MKKNRHHQYGLLSSSSSSITSDSHDPLSIHDELKIPILDSDDDDDDDHDENDHQHDRQHHHPSFMTTRRQQAREQPLLSLLSSSSSQKPDAGSCSTFPSVVSLSSLSSVERSNTPITSYLHDDEQWTFHCSDDDDDEEEEEEESVLGEEIDPLQQLRGLAFILDDNDNDDLNDNDE